MAYAAFQKVVPFLMQSVLIPVSWGVIQQGFIDYGVDVLHLWSQTSFAFFTEKPRLAAICRLGQLTVSESLVKSSRMVYEHESAPNDKE